MINTYEEWWNSVDTKWDHLLELASAQLDLNSMASETPGRDDSPMTGLTILEEMNKLKKDRNPKLARYFAAIWSLASDAFARQRRPGWLTLCDLLSEEYVLHEGMEAPPL